MTCLKTRGHTKVPHRSPQPAPQTSHEVPFVQPRGCPKTCQVISNQEKYYYIYNATTPLALQTSKRARLRCLRLNQRVCNILCRSRFRPIFQRWVCWNNLLCSSPSFRFCCLRRFFGLLVLLGSFLGGSSQQFLRMSKASSRLHPKTSCTAPGVGGFPPFASLSSTMVGKKSSTLIVADKH